MQELMADYITTLDGYGTSEGWPGWWGLEGPEYLRWLEQQPEAIQILGANTYRLFAGMVEQAMAPDSGFRPEEIESVAGITRVPSVVFSSTLEGPLPWPQARLVSGDALEAVRELKRTSERPLATLGSLRLVRSLMAAGLVDRFRVVIFPVITGKTGGERIYDGYQDFALELLESRTLDGRIQLLEYAPTPIDGPPGARSAG